MKQHILLLILLLTYSFGYSQSNEFIGIMPGGGEHGTGVIYKTEPDGEFKSVVYSFEKAHGRRPVGELALAADGSFYGITNGGGLYNKGVLFQYLPDQQKYKTLFHFGAQITDGAIPSSGVLLCSNGKLYGSTLQGGTNNKGSLFWYDPALDSLFFFHSFESINSSGYGPQSAFVETMSGDLLIAAYSGGAFNNGAIYKVDTTSHIASKVADFNYSQTGSNPVGDFVEVSPNVFYGLTRLGGSSNKGVIFKFNLATNTLTKVKDFVNSTTGEYPIAGLMLASNGKLYGTTYAAPSYADIIFEFNPTDSSFKKLYEFTSAKGDHPQSVLVEGQNGILYGTTSYGGNASGDGTIYSYQIGSDSIIKLWSFEKSKYGGNPVSGMTLGKDGKLYGVLKGGSGVSYDGTLYSFDISTNTFDRHVFFNSSIQGIQPAGNLVQAANERVYGITQIGGENNLGVVYSLDPLTFEYTVEADFDDSTGWYMDGGLLEASNGKLYGVCMNGLNNSGTIIEFDPVTKTLSKRAEFDGVLTGKYGSAGLVEGDSGLLYGIRSSGGVNDQGTLFSYNSTTHELLKLHDFSQTTSGRGPQGTPVFLNGKLYGLTYTGGSKDEGVLYRFDLVKNSMVIMLSFSRNVSGKRPVGSLLLANNGLLYGTTTEGGDYSVGSLFEYNPSTNTLLVKASFFMGVNEEQASGALMQGSNGHIYGLTYLGGDYDAGVMFEYRIGTKLLTRIYHLESEIHGNYAHSAPLELNPCRFTGTISLHNELVARAIDQEYQWLDCADNYKAIPGETNKNFKPKVNGNYAVEISSRFCKDTSDCIAMIIESVNQAAEDFVNIYPNPSNGYIHLELRHDEFPVKIQVLNSLGTVCHEESINASKATLSTHFSPGIYYVVFQQGERRIASKVVVF